MCGIYHGAQQPDKVNAQPKTAAVERVSIAVFPGFHSTGRASGWAWHIHPFGKMKFALHLNCQSACLRVY